MLILHLEIDFENFPGTRDETRIPSYVALGVRIRRKLPPFPLPDGGHFAKATHVAHRFLSFTSLAAIFRTLE